jgi:phage baseplate assembly protein W
MNSIKEQVKVYLFTQTYLDLLQSKYGSLLGKYMFTSIGNSLDFYIFTLQNLNIDFE